MRRVACVALALALAGVVAFAPAGDASSDSSLVIRPGRSIGKIQLGMTQQRLLQVAGRPRYVVQRPSSFGRRTVEWQYGFGADYVVVLFGRPGRLRAVRVGTTLVRERTSRRVGVGSSERAIRRAYPALRCEPLKTELFGTVRVVRTIQRECTLHAPNGRRTIFTTDVLEELFEVVTLRSWARRAEVIEVSVAVAA